MKKLLSLLAVVLIATSLYGFDASHNDTTEESMITIQGIGNGKNDIGSLD